MRLSMGRSAKVVAAILLASSIPAAHADDTPSIREGVLLSGFEMATGSCVSPTGDIAFTRYDQGSVSVWRNGGVKITYSGFARPHDCAFDASGNLFVAQFGRESGPSAVARVDATTGNIDYRWKSGFVGIGGIAISPDGSFWMADSDGNRLYRAAEGGAPELVPGIWPAVHGLRFDRDGTLWLTAYRAGSVIKRAADGSVSTWATGLNTPVAIALDGSGGAYVAEQGRGTLVHLRKDGTRADLLTGLSAPTGVVVALGFLLVSTWDNSRSVIAKRAPLTAPLPPQTLTAQYADGSVAVSWKPPTSDGGLPILNYTVTASPGGATCLAIAPETSCNINGLIKGSRYSFTVSAANASGTSMASAPAVLVIGNRPNSPTSISTSPGDRAVTVSWRAPENQGDGQFRGYRVTSIPDSRQCTAAATESSCRVTGLRNGVSYVFEVVAINDCGISDAAQSPLAESFSWPLAPENVRVKTRTQTSASIQWDAADGNGAPVLGYDVAVSRDGGASWTSSEVTADARTEWTVPGLGGASAAWVKVAAVNSAGAGPWSDSFLVTTKGAKPMRVQVQDSSGSPVVGGAITWRMNDDSAWSARTYGLTDDGVIEFPMAPAGAVTIAITGALTEDGARVTGSTTTILGFSSAIVRVPSTPFQSRTVRVVMPNGMPVANANVSVDSRGAQYVDGDCIDTDWFGSCLEYEQVMVPGNVSDTYTSGGFTFSVPVAVAGITTDVNGEARFSGFFSGDPTATVVYNDGIIVQQQKVVLDSARTRVELDYMPWVEVAQSTVTADLNTAVPVTVSVAEPTYQSIARGFLPRSMRAGVTVTVIPPKGAPKGSCKAQMTGKTNSQGKVTLKVCATKSGVYGFKTSGAASVSTFKLFVKGTAPMPVTSVTARSLQVGSVRATWGAPLFDGKSPVVSYTVTASAKGKKTVTKTVKANVKNVTLDGLANATTYTVTITATTKKGTSDPVTVSVPVA